MGRAGASAGRRTAGRRRRPRAGAARRGDRAGLRRRAARRPRAALRAGGVGARLRAGRLPRPSTPSSRHRRRPAGLADVAVPAEVGDGVVSDDDVELAVRQLVEPWTASSDGQAEVAAVEGDAPAALRALGLTHARTTTLTPADAVAWLAWAGASGGAHGRRRGAAAGRFGALWLVAALADLLDDWPLDLDELGARPASCGGRGGMPTSRSPAGSCSWPSRIPTRDWPGRSAPATRDGRRCSRAPVLTPYPRADVTPGRAARRRGRRARRLVGDRPGDAADAATSGDRDHGAADRRPARDERAPDERTGAHHLGAARHDHRPQPERAAVTEDDDDDSWSVRSIATVAVVSVVLLAIAGFVYGRVRSHRPSTATSSALATTTPEPPPE